MFGGVKGRAPVGEQVCEAERDVWLRDEDPYSLASVADRTGLEALSPDMLGRGKANNAGAGGTGIY